MEEDIKILKEWVERDRKIRNYSTESDFDKFCEEKNIAIENILNRLEQDERVIEAMAEWLFAYRWAFLQLEDYTNEEQVIDHFRKR